MNGDCTKQKLNPGHFGLFRNPGRTHFFRSKKTTCPGKRGHPRIFNLGPRLIAFHNYFFCLVLCLRMDLVQGVSKGNRGCKGQVWKDYKDNPEGPGCEIPTDGLWKPQRNSSARAWSRERKAEGAWLPSSPGFPESAARGGTQRHEIGTWSSRKREI